MRLVIQRVNKVAVTADEKIVGKIKKGLFVLVGVKKGDTKEKAEALASKLLKLRVMADDKDKMDLSAKSYFNVIKNARTIADLDGKKEISPDHLVKALQFNPK